LTDWRETLIEGWMSMAIMSRVRIGFAVFLIGALAAGFAFFRNEPIVDSHRQIRQRVLHFTLRRTADPIIVIGDSIMEASTLPRTFCGYPIVNAGLTGASTASDLGAWLIEALDGKRAAAILVALGTNDAFLGHDKPSFEANYASLLVQLAGVTDHLAVLSIPSIEGLPNVTAQAQAEATNRISDFNAALPALAAKSGALFVALPSMPTPHTIDGVHLDAAGYAVWDEAVLKGLSAACNSR
jgi:hypothetical protein